MLNNLFFHPYTKIEFMQNDLRVHRVTAARYLDRIVETGILRKVKIGRENYYINEELMKLFSEVNTNNGQPISTIESK